tara:strand:- start:1299 stop:2045 length:747 start_codon:yes stop_codon:yes gene_type:complete
MKIEHLACWLLTSGIACAQNTENPLKNHFNPAFIQELDATLFYSTIDILNLEFGLHKSTFNALLKSKNRNYQMGFDNYGYDLFNDAKFSISSSQNLNGTTTLGLGINIHHLQIYGIEKHSSASFNLGLSYITKHYRLYLFIENLLNNSYVENDLESRFILNGLYYWNTNLHSDLQLEESMHTGFHLKHRLSYNYQNYFNLCILQGFRPYEYGLRLGYKKGAFQWFSQYKKQAWAQTTGIGLIYTPIYE